MFLAFAVKTEVAIFVRKVGRAACLLVVIFTSLSYISFHRHFNTIWYMKLHRTWCVSAAGDWTKDETKLVFLGLLIVILFLFSLKRLGFFWSNTAELGCCVRCWTEYCVSCFETLRNTCGQHEFLFPCKSIQVFNGIISFSVECNVLSRFGFTDHVK